MLKTYWLYSVFVGSLIGLGGYGQSWAEKINPWQLNKPVELHRVNHAQRFNHVMFTGTTQDLRQFTAKHHLKAVVYTDFWFKNNVHVTNWQTIGVGAVWGACNETSAGRARHVVCVPVDANSQPVDPSIWQPQLLSREAR
jgi:hypothetical protein